jgi:hypothetical protein
MSTLLTRYLNIRLALLDEVYVAGTNDPSQLLIAKEIKYLIREIERLSSYFNPN